MGATSIHQSISKPLQLKRLASQTIASTLVSMLGLAFGFVLTTTTLGSEGKGSHRDGLRG